jgi:glycoside/pentoside/hexuronide:cation symporter, GPH family
VKNIPSTKSTLPLQYLCLFVLLACLIIPPQNYLALISVCIGAGIGMSAIQILPFASLPDVVEVDQHVYGSRREGAYYGINQFMYKLASGLSIAFVSYVLGVFGYQEMAPPVLSSLIQH